MPNARGQARQRAGARNERTLFAVACTPLLGGAWHRGTPRDSCPFSSSHHRLPGRTRSAAPPILRAPGGAQQTNSIATAKASPNTLTVPTDHTADAHARQRAEVCALSGPRKRRLRAVWLIAGVGVLMVSTAVAGMIAARSIASKFRVRSDLRIRQKRCLFKMGVQVRSP